MIEENEKMGVSSEAKFSLYYLDDNGSSNILECRISIGKDVFFLEVLIHEINELEVENIIMRFGFENVAIRYKLIGNKVKILPKDGYDEGQKWTGVVHLVSPYGFDSLIFPSSEKSKYKSLIRSLPKSKVVK